jgi:hypothetical protein
LFANFIRYAVPVQNVAVLKTFLLLRNAVDLRMGQNAPIRKSLVFYPLSQFPEDFSGGDRLIGPLEGRPVEKGKKSFSHKRNLFIIIRRFLVPGTVGGGSRDHFTTLDFTEES